MTKARPESMGETRLQANLLLQRILEGLAEGGFLEPVAAPDGTESYRITDAGCDYLDQHDLTGSNEVTRPYSASRPGRCHV